MRPGSALDAIAIVLREMTMTDALDGNAKDIYVRVRDHTGSSSTRTRGASFYTTLTSLLDKEGSVARLMIDFSGFPFVSPSFIDESLAKLIIQRPEYAGRIHAKGLSDVAKDGVRMVINTRRLGHAIIVE